MPLSVGGTSLAGVSHAAADITGIRFDMFAAGASSSGKTQGFGSCIRRFESSRPSHFLTSFFSDVQRSRIGTPAGTKFTITMNMTDYYGDQCNAKQ
jgi:hypothetical protein